MHTAFRSSALAFVAFFLGPFAAAQETTPTTGITWPLLGSVAPRAAAEISGSPWSIGGETLDRDFAVYANYRRYLGPLGAKAIRLQAGWAKCERERGVYDFTWLDRIIDDARQQGVQPWVELSYGNKLYAGGGGIGLGDGFPSSPEALAAWDKWVTAIVRRYKDRIHEWEIWNEPDINRTGAAGSDAYVDLHIRTATIIRGEQPKSRIFALGLAGSVDYADRVLMGLAARGKLDLVDAITFHGYPKNPDDTSNVDKLRAVVAKHGRAIALRQGETGAPSRYQENFALSKMAWSETTQAKWDLRRLLAHRAKDVPMNLFTLSDMHYRNPDGTNLRMNYKGLLATNPDQTIAYVKPAYRAAQTVFSLFDDRVSLMTDFAASTTSTRRVAATGYQHAAGDAIVALWFSDQPPIEDNATTAVDVTLTGVRFSNPVMVDVRTSTVYALPASSSSHEGSRTVIRQLPVYDSPVLIVEKSLVRITPTRR